MKDKRRELMATVLATNTDEHSTHDDIIEALAAALDHRDYIRGRLNKVGQEKSDLTREYKDDMARLEAEEADIQAECHHYTSTYHPDAAGGSDSWTQCDICGAEL